MISTSLTNSFDLSVKIGLLIFFAVYVAVAFIAYRQMGKLETWLASLSRYNFGKLAKIHLVLSIIGWFIALVLFII